MASSVSAFTTAFSRFFEFPPQPHPPIEDRHDAILALCRQAEDDAVHTDTLAEAQPLDLLRDPEDRYGQGGRIAPCFGRHRAEAVDDDAHPVLFQPVGA